MEEAPSTAKHFQRTRGIFKIHTKHSMLAIVSAFAIAYTFQSLLNIQFADVWAWAGTILPFAAFATIYNSFAQANDVDIKNALIQDWVALPIKIHLVIILISVVILGTVNVYKYFADPNYFEPRRNPNLLA